MRSSLRNALSLSAALLLPDCADGEFLGCVQTLIEGRRFSCAKTGCLEVEQSTVK